MPVSTMKVISMSVIDDHDAIGEVRISSAMPGDYFALLKPRVMSLVVFTALVGLLVAPGSIDPVLGAVSILCIAIGAGASGALNMWYDADIDAVMSRTAKRPIPSGAVTREEALGFGLFLSAFSIITAFTASQKKRINKRVTVKYQLNISFILYLVSMLILSFANEWWHLIVPLFAFGLAHGILIPTIQTLLVGFAPLNERAGFMSINSLVLRLGQTTGPLFIGLFYALGGVGIAFIGGSIVALIMLIISVYMVKVKNN
jgi:4-hydroxybenzoate polyprenyltransferase